MRIANIRLTRTDKEELNMEKIIFQSDDGTAAEFYVEEQTNIAGVTYLLVSDSQAVYAVFQQMLDDVNFEWRSDF